MYSLFRWLTGWWHCPLVQNLKALLTRDLELAGTRSGDGDTPPGETLPLPAALADWVTAFRREHGRAPRVLHIGNIANNAYNNAKLLNAAGLDCDVLCYDFYHSMGCPEWEDADFAGGLGNDFFPAWEQIDLHGFVRQPWFAQGPLLTALRYLKARRDGQPLRARLLWAALTVQRVWAGLVGRDRLMAHLDRLFGFVYRLAYIGLFCLDLATRVFLNKVCRLTPVPLGRFQTHRLLTWGGWDKALRGSQKQIQEVADFKTRCRELVAAFRAAFPERADALTMSDLKDYQDIYTAWVRLFRRYDLIIGYSTLGLWPMLAGVPYTALEHGTLRTIPFDANACGRLTALTYHLAGHAFVTNADCLDNAHRLAGDRVTFLNHPFDDQHGLQVPGWEDQRAELQRELDAQFLFFFPTRQDWVPGTGYADKANDVFLRAFARLRAEGVPVGLVCCRWGRNVKESQRLLADAGVARHVKWVEPLGIVRFERMARACHLVADQFKLGAFGGVLFKSMAAGVPICTYLDEPEMARRFGACPPVINARTEAEILAGLRRACAEPDFLADLARRSRRWIEEHHSSRETVERQLAVFGPLLLVRGEARAA